MTDKDLPLPRSLDELRKVHALGTGTYGIVYLVQSTVTNAFYAMKEIPRSRNYDPLLSKEINILSSVDHPLIVKIFKVFHTDRVVSLLMEYVEGGELYRHIHTKASLSQDEAVFYIAEIIMVLEYLRTMDIVYRDLKPENIILSKTGHIKLIDFGLAKHIPDGRTGTFCGSPNFLAPEVIQGGLYGYGADLWALGIIAFEMITGHLPFDDLDVMKMYRKIVSGKPSFPGNIDKSAKNMIQGLLAKNPQKRTGVTNINELKSHPYFKNCTFDINTMKPPMIPVLRSASDTSYFDIPTKSKPLATDAGEVQMGPVIIPLSKLIEKATREDLIADHPSLWEDLALTNWWISQPHQFLQQLIMRFALNFSPDSALASLNSRQLRLLDPQKKFKQDRILQILEKWIPNLTVDNLKTTAVVNNVIVELFKDLPNQKHTELKGLTSNEIELEELLRAFVKHTQGAFKASEGLEEELEKVKVAKPVVIEFTEPEMPAPNSPIMSSSSVPPNFNSARRGSQPNVQSLQKMLMTADQIVAQIMDYEVDLFCKIKLRGLIDHANNVAKDPIVSQLIDKFNWTSRWVITQILHEHTPTTRASVIGTFVACASQFNSKGNFNALMEVLSALHSAPVSRLKQSWAAVPESVTAELHQLDDLMNSSRNYHKYRERYGFLYYQRIPLIPFFEAFLSDIRFYFATYKPDPNSAKLKWDFVSELGELAREFSHIQELIGRQQKEAPPRGYTDSSRLYNLRALSDKELYEISNLREESSTGNMGDSLRASTARATVSGKPTPQNQQKGSASSKLTLRDWNLLTSHSERISYPKGKIIYNSGDVVSNVSLLVRGKAMLFRNDNGVRQDLVSILPDETYGETSLLGADVPSWFGVSAVEDCEVVLLKNDFILKLFNTDIELAGRFFKQVASITGQHLRAATAYYASGDVDTTETPARTPAELASFLNSDDEQKLKDDGTLEFLFGLTDELAIKLYPCKIGILNGILFVTPHHVCCYARAFAFSQKIVLPIKEITDIKEKRDVIQITSGKKTRKITLDEKDVVSALEIIRSIWLSSSNRHEVHRITSLMKDLGIRVTTNPGAINPETILLKSEWAVILKGAQILTYPPGTVLLSQGEKPNKLFQISRGTAIIQVTGSDDTTRVVATRSVGDVFGEISFLNDRAFASASVVAENEVEIYALDREYIDILLFARPELAQRFYKYLAVLMHNRTCELESKIESKAEPKTPVKI